MASSAYQTCHRDAHNDICKVSGSWECGCLLGDSALSSPICVVSNSFLIETFYSVFLSHRHTALLHVCWHSGVGLLLLWLCCCLSTRSVLLTSMWTRWKLAHASERTITNQPGGIYNIKLHTALCVCRWWNAHTQRRWVVGYNTKVRVSWHCNVCTTTKLPNSTFLIKRHMTVHTANFPKGSPRNLKKFKVNIKQDKWKKKIRWWIYVFKNLDCSLTSAEFSNRFWFLLIEKVKGSYKFLSTKRKKACLPPMTNSFLIQNSDHVTLMSPLTNGHEDKAVTALLR